MRSRKRKWLIASGLAFALLGITIASVLWAVSTARKRFEPYIREQAIGYLQRHFESQVRIGSLHIQIPPMTPLHWLMTRGKGTFATIEGMNVDLTQNRATGTTPILAIRKFAFELDLGTVFNSARTIKRVQMEGLKITIPPKGERTPLPVGGSHKEGILIQEVVVTNAQLLILPKIPGKEPLTFNIASLRLESVGKDVAMKYQAVLTNPKPVGQIQSSGSFGPWVPGSPGDTPLQGHYIFNNADLSIFTAIAGTLHSAGDFEGTLSAINAHGTATVPDFRLKSSGNPIALATTFDVLVDGGNGDTILQPVHATLGATRFTTSGAVIRKAGDPRRSITLDVSMPSGNLRDVMSLAMKGPPGMEGKLRLKTKIAVPPLTGKVEEKLLLDGQFSISEGHFLQSKIQDNIDTLSRRGQGQPNNQEIDEVFSNMKGSFRMEDQTITFRSLSFAIPGAGVKLTGDYDMAKDELDFHGSLGLDASVSQTVTGWKRWALKPADPFFAKNGAGTFLHIKVDGSSKSPHFAKE